jgi:hypothetical protein
MNLIWTIITKTYTGERPSLNLCVSQHGRTRSKAGEASRLLITFDVSSERELTAYLRHS